jgi:hypothetical protein
MIVSFRFTTSRSAGRDDGSVQVAVDVAGSKVKAVGE